MVQTCLLSTVSSLLLIVLGSISWNIKACRGEVDFVTKQLDVGEVQHVIWKEDWKKADEYAVQIGLPSELTTALIDYCKEIGLWELFWEFQYDNPLQPGTSKYFQDQNGHQWQVNRPESKWQSDMHWIQPSKEDTHEAYLKALHVQYTNLHQSLKIFQTLPPHIETLRIGHCNDW